MSVKPLSATGREFLEELSLWKRRGIHCCRHIWA
jgi:hypothetical protein